MNVDKIAELEYEALQAEKRDKINARLQVWSLLIALVGAFGFASVQSGSISDLIMLYPLLAACIARYAGHSERVLDQVKARLLTIEAASGYKGYEQENRAKAKARGSGSHMKALRDALVMTEVLASIVTTYHLFAKGLAFMIVVMLIEIGAIIVTIAFLRERREFTPRTRKSRTKC